MIFDADYLTCQFNEPIPLARHRGSVGEPGSSSVEDIYHSQRFAFGRAALVQIDTVLGEKLDELTDDFSRTLKGWIGQATSSKALPRAARATRARIDASGARWWSRFGGAPRPQGICPSKSGASRCEGAPDTLERVTLAFATTGPCDIGASSPEGLPLGDSSLRASLDRRHLLGIEPVVDSISPMLHQLSA